MPDICNPRKIVFCTYGSIYSSLVLGKLLKSSTLEVTAVVSSSRNLRITENKFISDIKRIRSSGWRYSIYLWLVTQASTICSKWLKYPSIEYLCSQNNIPNFKTSNINSHSMQSTLKELNPDILLCAHFNQLVHPVIYEIPKYASVNMHPSLLPALKGVDPSFYSLLENNTTSGATLHHLDQNFDTGAIIAQSEVIIEENDSVFSLNLKLFEAGTELIFQYLDTQEDIQTLKKTVHSSSQYDSWPTKTQIKVFKDANKSLISWKDIHRLIQFGSI